MNEDKYIGKLVWHEEYEGERRWWEPGVILYKSSDLPSKYHIYWLNGLHAIHLSIWTERLAEVGFFSLNGNTLKSRQ